MKACKIKVHGMLLKIIIILRDIEKIKQFENWFQMKFKFKIIENCKGNII